MRAKLMGPDSYGALTTLSTPVKSYRGTDSCDVHVRSCRVGVAIGNGAILGGRCVINQNVKIGDDL